MAMYELADLSPQVAESAWVADSAQVMGRVALEKDSSVWFGVVIAATQSTFPLAKEAIFKMAACCTPTMACL